MARRERRWVFPTDQGAEVWQGYSRAATAVLRARGLVSVEEAGPFLNPTRGDLYSPWSILGMEAAVTRTLAAVARSGLSTRTAKSTSLIFDKKGWRVARASRRQ